MINRNECDCTERINHIKCEVKNCYYHGTGNTCTASMIEVTPSHANTEQDTACSTFKSQVRTPDSEL